MDTSAQPTVLHENLSLVETADSVLLDILLADTQARRLILARISDRVAIIAPGQFDVLLARLRKLGYTPKVKEM